MNIQYFPEHETITLSKNRFLSICLELNKERIYSDRLMFNRLLTGFKRFLEQQEEGTEAKIVQAEGRAIDVLFEGPDEQTASVQGAKNKLGWMIDDLYDEWEKAFQKEFEQKDPTPHQNFVSCISALSKRDLETLLGVVEALKSYQAPEVSRC